MPNARAYGGFGSLLGGVNGGIAASLIRADMVASAVNSTMRGALLSTRPPWKNHPLTFDSQTTKSRWFGIFQGALQYDGEIGQSGWVVSRGGKLFFINSDTFVVSEITPRLFVVTTAEFTVPAVNATVDVFVNSVSAIATGDTVYIDSGKYLVTNRFTGELELKYIGTPNAAHATAPAGSGVLNSSQLQIFEYQTNPASYDFIYMFQAENYAIILGGQHKTVIFDGSSARQAGWNEVPPGILGAYGWGRIWIARADRRTFLAGDIVFGPSGTPQKGFRDAILKFTENDFLNEGGAFGVPYNAGPITSMQFLAAQDTSLGVGVLLVGTTNMVFSVNAPVDRTTWKNLTYPIQTVSLLDYGPEGPRSCVPVDGDMWYRSTDGFRSFIVARRNFPQPGNTPLSREITPVIDFDTDDLLFFGSGIKFDNRLLQTVSPFRSPSGVQHRGLAVVNFDLVSSIQGKSAPAWEGTWTGLNILQMTKGRIRNKERAFIFARGNDLELWEIYKNGYYDELTTISDDGHKSISRSPISGAIETRSDDHGDPTQLKKLHMGELYIDQIFDSVTLTIKFRPDQYPTWITWATINLCATVSQCTLKGPVGSSCSMWRMNAKQYASRITIPQPPESCNTIAGIPVDRGHEFQFRLERSGSCRIRMFKSHADLATEPQEGECPATVQCKEFPDCGTDLFTYDSHVGGIPPDVQPPSPPDIPPPVPPPSPPPNPDPVSAQLNGLIWAMPCPPNGHCVDPADQVTTVVGPIGTTWRVTIRIRGIVELRTYSPGTIIAGTDGRCILDGVYNAGSPENIYRLIISAPAQDYQLNRNHVTPIESNDHKSVDYTFAFNVNAGATVTIKAQSVDGLEYPNLSPTRVVVVGPTDPPILVAQPFSGQFLQMDCISVTQV